MMQRKQGARTSSNSCSTNVRSARVGRRERAQPSTADATTASRCPALIGTRMVPARQDSAAPVGSVAVVAVAVAEVVASVAVAVAVAVAVVSAAGVVASVVVGGAGDEEGAVAGAVAGAEAAVEAARVDRAAKSTVQCPMCACSGGERVKQPPVAGC